MDMTGRAAFITAQAACCQAKLMAMAQQNDADRHAGRPVSFQPDDFEDAPNLFQLGWNDVLAYLHE